MASDEDSRGWFVRTRGRVLGPLTWTQLQSLRDRGQLARFDEVSQDRRSWIGADRVPRLFPKLDPTHSRPSSAGLPDLIMLDEEDVDSRTNPVRPAIEHDSEWYFARNKTQHGPVRLSQLQRMAASGELGPETLVWSHGLEHWTPGSEIDELNFPVRLEAISAAGGDARALEHVGVSLPQRQVSSPLTLADPPVRTSILAINSLIMGFLWLFGLGSLAALGLGIMALRTINGSRGSLTGKRLAIAGILLGIIGLITAILVLMAPGVFWDRTTAKSL